jgi:zinc transport system substrate-binding protein
MTTTRIRLGLVAAALLAAAHAAGQTAEYVRTLKVAVSILPQAYFVERVGGTHVDVQVLVGPGLSPHTFEPTPKQLAALADARAYFRVGVDFEEALVPRLTGLFPKLRIVDTRAGVPLRRFAAQEAACEHAGHDHGEAPGRPDPHIWLNPLLVKTQAQTICDTLCTLDAARADEYRSNLAAFQADLDRVHAQLAAALAPLKGREVFVFHPAFGYFTDAYGLRQTPVEIEGKEPTARQLQTLIARARAADVKVIFVQPQFSKKAAQTVAEAIGGVVAPLDDLARDYLANLTDIAAKIEAAQPNLRRQSGAGGRVAPLGARPTTCVVGSDRSPAAGAG